MDFYFGTYKEGDEWILHSSGQNRFRFCLQQFCEGELWVPMWYWGFILVSSFVGTIGGSEQLDEVIPSLRYLCFNYVARIKIC